MTDFAAAFPGSLDPARLSYEQFFGLTLNLGRIQARQSYAIFQGLNAASADRLPAWFFEPVSASSDEARDKAFDHNAARAVARAMAGKTR